MKRDRGRTAHRHPDAVAYPGVLRKAGRRSIRRWSGNGTAGSSGTGWRAAGCAAGRSPGTGRCPPPSLRSPGRGLRSWRRTSLRAPPAPPPWNGSSGTLPPSAARRRWGCFRMARQDATEAGMPQVRQADAPAPADGEAGPHPAGPGEGEAGVFPLPVPRQGAPAA